jgi:hypothetical protein
VDREIRGMLTTLRVLASGTSLREEDLQRFHARAQVALKDTGTHVIVLDENLNQLLNTRVEFGTRLGPTSDPAPARFAQEQRVAVVSDGFMGRTARRWVFNVILPPSVSGLYGRYLVMTQDAQLGATITVEPQRVVVEVSREIPTSFLRVIGITTVRITAAATAEVRYGIEGNVS